LEHYPPWLYESIIKNDLPWESANEWSFRQFSEKYTLHDSYWIGLFYDIAYDNNVILAIVWDSVWLPDEIAESTAVTDDWPVLFIKVQEVLQVSTSGYKDIGGIQRGIHHSETTEVGDKELFVISDHDGGVVELVFTGTVEFLALNRNKEVLAI
jgi:hypothetical protein